MATGIIVAAILIGCAVGFRSMRRHLRGEGSCCGGGGGNIASEPKRLKETIIGKKTVYIEGMHCEHCKNSVERQINHLDGACANVDLANNCAVVSMTRLISDDELRQAVAMASFTVTDIEFQEA